MNERLVAEEGILKGLVLPFEDGEEWVIGRDPDACQLILEDPAASRKHVLCKKTPEGITVENLSDSNPIEVNDKEIDSPHLLKSGDTVKIGSGNFRYFSDIPEEKKEEEPIPPEVSPVSASKEALGTEKHDSILENIESAKDMGKTDVNFDMEEMGRWLLKVIGGPNNGAEFSMQSGSTYLIGTDPNSCDIVFHDTSVSRQHARITINENNHIFLEDLKSRNGTLLDGETVKEKAEVQPNMIVTLGTSSFVIYDREGNMQTIISPLLPSLVKVLGAEKKSEGETKQETPQSAMDFPKEAPRPKEKSMSALILMSIITGLFVLAAIGTTTLFKSEPVKAGAVVDTDTILKDTLAATPSLKFLYNKANGSVVLFGHLLTTQDKTQLLYALQNLPFVKSIDDSGVVIDEFVWQETNQVLNKNPNWRTITLQSPSAGQFVLTGVLQTKKQADQLYEYITSNFPYLDRLEKRVVIEEDVINTVNSDFEKVGIHNVKVALQNGELVISGGVPAAKREAFDSIIEDLKKIPGVRDVRVQTSSIAPEQAMINVTDRYEVTGFSRIGNNISVVINGRIVTKGDVIDGMVIKEISSGAVFLEKDNINYRIDFSK